MVVRASQVTKYRTFRLNQIRVRRVQLLVIVSLPPFHRVNRANRVVKGSNVVGVRRVLIKRNIHRLANTTNVVNNVLGGITVPTRRFIMTRTLLGIAFRRTLAGRRVANLGQVSTPPLRNAVLRGQRAVRRSTYNNRNKTTQTEPVQFYVHNTN